MAFGGIVTAPDQLGYSGPHLLKLNLGCSDVSLKGYVNVDLVPPCDQVADLEKLWPWQDSSVEKYQML